VAERHDPGLDRRDFVRASLGALAAASCSPTPPTTEPTNASESAMTDAVPATMPVVFVSHGAPTMALDRQAGADFARLAQALPKPRAMLVVSAHWLDAPATIGTRSRRELMYDFSGFPAELYRVRYEAPAAADVADELQRMVPSLQRADERPWDHGVWVPLLHMYPRADVPVLQVSVPYRWSPRQLFELGRSLAPLRQQGVLVLGSGGMVHNLGRLDWDGGDAPPAWAVNFEGWVRERLGARTAGHRRRGRPARLPREGARPAARASDRRPLPAAAGRGWCGHGDGCFGAGDVPDRRLRVRLAEPARSPLRLTAAHGR
jgi:4,5-DOPA dioxygenase extradiol